MAALPNVAPSSRACVARRKTASKAPLGPTTRSSRRPMRCAPSTSAGSRRYPDA